MTMAPPFLVLPRSGASEPTHPQPAIPAPTEHSMTSTFGALLPAAQYLTTPHGRAAYYLHPPTTPSPSATPLRILMIHGVQTPALGLHPLATALRTRLPAAHIALVDLWGHGLSATPREPHTPPLFHALVDAVLAALAWPRAHLLGFSFGGSTAVGYAAAASSRARVLSLALVAPAGLLRAGAFEERVRREYFGGGDTGMDEEAARDWIVRFLEGGASGEVVVPGDWRARVGRGEVVAEAVRAWEMREHEGHAASVVAIFRDGGVLDNHEAFVEVAKAGIPCVCVVGDVDSVCSAEALQQVGLSNVVVVPQAGHALVRERVPEVAQPIEEFWKSLS